jgi:outer membrane protein assembly factor BamA
MNEARSFWASGKSKHLAFLFAVGVSLSGCLGTRHLKEGQRHLYQNRISAPKGFPVSELSSLHTQPENERVLGLPIHFLVHIYYLGESRYDKASFERKLARKEEKFNAKMRETTRERKITNLQYKKQKKADALTKKIEQGNMFMQWGEPIAVYDSLQVGVTAERFRNYLFTNGYFTGTVGNETKSEGRLVTVKYTVTPGEPYRIDTVLYRIDSETIRRIVSETGGSLLVKGSRFRQDDLSKERERLDFLLKDEGYFDFSRQYIDFEVDTSFLGSRKVAVRTLIKNPIRREDHHRFKLDSVVFVTDVGIDAPVTLERQSARRSGITYKFFNDEYNKNILRQRVFMHEDSLYSRTNTLATQRQLANLDIFKFVNINYDTTGGRFIANIFASPLDRYSWSNEVGLTVTQGFPGPYYYLSFKRRNLFGGLENFEISGRFGFEGVAAATEIGSVYQSTEASLNMSLTFPQFLWPLRHEKHEQLGRVNPKTRVLGGFTYSDRPEYRRSIYTFSATYLWEKNNRILYSLTPASMNIIQSEVSPDFQQELDRQDSLGNTISRSFEPSFVTSTLFSMTWNPKGYGAADRNSTFLRLTAESGGTIFNFLNADFITSKGLEYYQYLRLGFDVRRNQWINKTTVLAYRLNTGIAYAYGPGSALPYERYYFAGGSTSLRAWRPRRLGLGAQPPPINTDPVALENDGYFNYQYERPGTLLLEGSVELRKTIVGFVEGAVFVDAGNIWSLKPLADQPDAEFKFAKSFRDFAVGTGFGLRFDFSFLVLRFDVGIKVIDPAREPGDRFMLTRAKFFRPFGVDKEPVIYNIGVGYPF